MLARANQHALNRVFDCQLREEREETPQLCLCPSFSSPVVLLSHLLSSD